MLLQRGSLHTYTVRALCGPVSRAKVYGMGLESSPQLLNPVPCAGGGWFVTPSIHGESSDRAICCTPNKRPSIDVRDGLARRWDVGLGPGFLLAVE